MAELSDVTEAATEVASEAVRKVDFRLLIGGFLVGAGVGVLVGGWWAKRNLDKKYDEKYKVIAEEEIDAMREHFRKRLIVREEKPDLGAVGEKAQELGYASPVSPKPEADPTAIEPERPTKPPVPIPPGPRPGATRAEVMAEAQDRTEPLPEDFITDAQHWIAGETPNRNHRIPYVIHVDERGEADFDSLTYTYYVADDVLCDEAGKALDARDEVVGDHNLDRFGHGSGDPNVVYIRNDHLALEIEVVRDPGSYAKEVHGLRHSAGGIEPRRRRRETDE